MLVVPFRIAMTGAAVSSGRPMENFGNRCLNVEYVFMLYAVVAINIVHLHAGVSFQIHRAC